MYGPQLIDYGNPVADHPHNLGLRAWWLALPTTAGGSQLHDLYGRHPLALTSGPTWATGEGWPDAVLFDGADDYAANTTLDPGGFLTDWTSEAVIVPTSLPQSGMVATCGVDTGTSPFQGWSWGVSSGGSSSSQLTGLANGVAWAGSGYSLPTAGRAYHVVVLMTGGTVWAFYVDGVQVGGTSTSALANATTGDIRLGSQTNSRYFAGRVDSHRLYDRAVTAGEVAALYDQWRRGYPDLLRRYTPKAWLFPTSPPPPPPAGSSFPAAVVGGGYGW